MLFYKKKKKTVKDNNMELHTLDVIFHSYFIQEYISNIV